MDVASQQVVTALDALKSVSNQLGAFGYGLYRETRAKSWTPPRGITFCGKGHRPALTHGFAIWCDDSGNRSIIFSMMVAWDSNHWSVHSIVEDEDTDRDEITDVLWESEEYKATTLEELVGLLQTAADALVSSAGDERVAAHLATIERSL